MIYRFAVFARFPDASTARAALGELPAMGLGDTKIKLFECGGADCGNGILAGLMNNSTWAESDARRGLSIGVGVGGVLGTAFGFVLFSLLGMSAASGMLLGVVMGSSVGALMSGIVGSGLVNPSLARLVRDLQPGEALVSISSRTAEEHRRATGLLRTGSLDVTTNR